MKKIPVQTATDDDEGTRPQVNLSFLPEFIGFNVGRAQTNLRRDYLEHLGKDTMRFGQFSLLAVIAANPGWSQIELARELQIDKATIVALFDHMEKLGLIERRRSTTDRRKHAAHITEAGLAALEELRARCYEHERKFRERFTADELKTLSSLLLRLHPE